MSEARGAARTIDALAGVRAYRDRPEHRVVGLMTGTSADAIDAALVRFRGVDAEAEWELLTYRETPLESALRREVLEMAAVEAVDVERMLRLDAALGERYAAAVMELLAAESLTPDRVDAIGCHGQTIRHVPRHRDRATGGADTLTWQIGSSAILAERTGITVVSDFRRRDAAAGGEGAPLVPIADWSLFRSGDESRLLLNLGGMANVTHLPRGGGLDQVMAFDTGPGNAVLDALMRISSDGALQRDEGGAAAAHGRASDALLEELLADPFFALEPPRSTGRERFGDPYAKKLHEVGLAMGLSSSDILATAVELTAASVELAVKRFVRPRGEVDTVFVSGGGVRNQTLMRSLERRLAPAHIRPLGTLGVPPEAKEALAFAFLAHRTLCGMPGNVPSATGAARAVVLGQITPGHS
jgi:anhydro-N-acetylmuramic acid kinase